MATGGLTRALAVQVTRFSRGLARANKGTVGGVHQARVASRRLREAIGALAAVVPKRDRTDAAKTLRQMTRALGAVRECDVTRKLLAAEAARHRWPAASVAHVAEAIERERRQRLRALQKTARHIAWQEAAGRVLRAIRVADDRPHRLAAVATAQLRRRERAREWLEQLATLGTLYVPDHLHAVRLTGKKLRYALEWERDLGARAWVRERSRLERTQDQLGEWHDLVVLQDYVHRCRRSGDYPRITLVDFKQMASQLERECRARHARVRAEAPALIRLAAATATK